MHNFFFHNPCKIIFGNGRISALGSEAEKLGSRALLVYGRRHLETSGGLARITGDLRRSGIIVKEFGGISPNPTFRDAGRGIARCREKNCDLVIGVGGGSAMDTARAISAGFFFGDDLTPMFTGRKGVRKRLPLLLVPTLPGAGSATGHGMVLRDEERALKLGCGGSKLFADTAIIDPELMIAAPKLTIARAAVDGFCHAMEFFCHHSAIATGLQKRLLADLARTIFLAAAETARHPDPGAMGEIAWAGELIMHGMTGAGLGWTSFPLHAIEHGLGGIMDSAHGAGLAFIARGWFRRQQENPAAELAEFCRKVFHISGNSLNEDILKGAEYFNDWIKEMGLSTDKAFRKIDENRIGMIVSGAAVQARIWRIRDLDEKKITLILKAALLAA